MRARFLICIIPLVGAVLCACSVGGTSPNETQMQQARTACTQVGLPPGSSEVGDCAARMQAALSAGSQ
jgi:hypothetical protein